jgi:DNA replication protein DnaC
MKLIKDITSSLPAEEVDYIPEVVISSWEQFCNVEGIAPIYANVQLSDLKGFNEIAKETFKSWLRREINTMLFIGGPGSGKTHASLAFLRWAFETKKWCRFLTSEKLLSLGKEFGTDHLRRIYGDTAYLVIDDLGVERPAEWETQYLFSIIDERFNRKLPTIITTNLDTVMLEQLYTKRTMSRLQSFCIKFMDVDLRKFPCQK